MDRREIIGRLLAQAGTTFLLDEAPDRAMPEKPMPRWQRCG